MLIFDQLKKDDPQLRFLATVVFGGLLVLLAGLWWVQVVSSRHFQKNLESQSIRTIRIPPMRGKILDREGRALAENRPSYNVDLYLEELSRSFQKAYSEETNQVHQQVVQREKELGRKLTPQEKKQFALTRTLNDQLQRQARFNVISSMVQTLSAGLQQPITTTQQEFESHYLKERALPMPILANLNPAQIARFEEQSTAVPGMDLEVHPIRYYPNGTIAAHLLGYLVHARDDDESDGEPKYSYRLPEFEGSIVGIEGIFENELHGTAGERSVLVNNKGYKQSETVWAPAEPGQNVVLTIDLDIQKAADEALDSVKVDAHGAVVVMDVRNGDVLAMASSPTYDPNHFIQRPAQEIWSREWERWTNEDVQVQMNHALQGKYPPGSIFKIVVGLAALEQNAFDPHKIFHSDGYFMLGNRRIGDTAHAGDFDFDRALAKSSNPYFIDLGLRPGVLPKIIAIGQKLHFGERTGLLPHQESGGNFPTPMDIASSEWRLGHTANLSIGQDRIAITPLQVAVMISAVANGGTVYWPRVVSRIENADGTTAQAFPAGRMRDAMGVSARSLRIVHEAMLADVESKDGTGHAASVTGLRIAGKTGTAEVEKNGHIDNGSKITWFASFAPYENPKYAVVVMVVSGASGGLTCAPLAHKVYEAIQEAEVNAARKKGILAETR
jgi:penicillin-binding protein 2